MIDATDVLAHKLLENDYKDVLAGRYDAVVSRWSYQGLGMLRCYMDDRREHRLHVWNTDRAIENVSAMHTHPWDFESEILTGTVENVRYVRVADNRGELFDEYKLLCGENACTLSDPRPVYLTEFTDWSGPGNRYYQRASEIHRSKPTTGCVTLVQRTVPEGKNPDHALVFTEHGKPWVDAAPRPATPQEILIFLGTALEKWGEKE